MSVNEGFLAGALTALLIFLIWLLIRKSQKKNCEFDERQHLIRGKGFQYGFFTLLIYNVIYGAAYMDEMPDWCDNTTGIFVGVGLAVLVFGVYCIWNGAYMNLNQKPKEVYLFFAIACVVNFAVGIMNICDGSMVENGRITFGSVNLILGIIFAVFAGTFWLKTRRDSKEAE